MTPERVVRLNKKLLEGSLEVHHVRSFALLESAVASPQNFNAYEDENDLLILASQLVKAIGQNHAFEQGNKRTAFVAGFTFLRLNGCGFKPMDSEDFGKSVEDLILGTILVPDFAQSLLPFVIMPNWDLSVPDEGVETAENNSLGLKR